MPAPFADSGRYSGKGTLVQRLRLYSGLVLFGFVLIHYANHMLGHVSLEAMETGLALAKAVYASGAGLVVLYGAMLVHVVLALARLAALRHWRRPAWEWLQIGLGLAIPWFLLSHMTYTRLPQSLIGIEIGYERELQLLWPAVWLQQSMLLLIVWLHGCLGIHFWLRLSERYERWLPWLAAGAVLVPALALTGWVAAARRLVEEKLAQDGGQRVLPIPVGVLEGLQAVEDNLQLAALVLAGGMILILMVRWLLRRFSPTVRVSYGDGRTVTATPGTTLLDISRANGIPHMSVCGGRARCSTCRTLVIEGVENLSSVGDAERSLLLKLNADANIRLACQSKVRGDIAIRPLVQPRSSLVAPRNADPLGWGVEREIAVLFLDIRGFSRISEKSLPYDVVFILNSLFGEVGSAIEAHRGYIDKFMGDGLMALFGLNMSASEASRDALRAALAAEQAAASASRILTQHLHEPLRIGIGIHTGQAVIGRIGKTSDQRSPSRLTAVGGTVNIAARLESSTKEFGNVIVASAHTLEMAGIGEPLAIGERTSISVHNITDPVDVVAVRDHEALRRALDVPAGVLAASVAPVGAARREPVVGPDGTAAT